MYNDIQLTTALRT